MKLMCNRPIDLLKGTEGKEFVDNVWKEIMEALAKDNADVEVLAKF
jgi:hypothetical protein